MPIFINFQSGRELTPRQWLKDPQESLAALHEFRPFIAMDVADGCRKTAFGQCSITMMVSGWRWIRSEAAWTFRSCKAARSPHTHMSVVIRSLGILPRDLSTVSPVEMWFSPLPPQLHDVLREHALRVLGGEHRLRHRGKLLLRYS